MIDDINTKRTELANQMAAAGAAVLDFNGTAAALAAIPDTEPQQYVAAGTPENIAAIPPATICPQRRMRHGERPTEELQWEDTPAATSGDAPDLQQLKALALAATPGPWFYQENSDAYTHIVRPTANLNRIIASGTQTSEAHGEPTGRYIAAANPAVVLGLIASIERAAAPAPAEPTKAEVDAEVESYRRGYVEGMEEGARLAVEPATASGDEPRWDENGEPWNEAAEQVERDRAAATAVPGDMLADFSAWMAKRGPLGAGASPERIFFAGHSYGRRAAVSAATKPTADLSKLQSAYDIMHKALCDISQPADAGCGCSFPCRCKTVEAEAINAESMRDIAIDALSDAERIIDFGVEQSLLATKPAGDEPELSRAHILEEAAKACEQLYTGLGGPIDDPHPDAVLVNGAISDCVNHIRRMRSAAPTAAPADQVRNQALEEIALLIKLVGEDWEDFGMSQKAAAAEYLANYIRSQKSAATQTTEGAGQ